MNMIIVKPAPGYIIRNPDNSFKKLPAEGAVVPMSEYWIRREAEGGVIITPAN